MNPTGEMLAYPKKAFDRYEGVYLPRKGTHFMGQCPSQSKRPIDTESVLYKFSTVVFSQLPELTIHTSDIKPSKNPIFELEELQGVLKLCVDTYIKHGDFIDPAHWIDKNAPSESLIKCLSGIQFRHPYAQKVECVPESHLVVFGDIHGSLHLFLRAIWREVVKGFLNEQLIITDPNGYIILLGDLIDRGHYSIEVLYLAMLLKIHNPDRVFILRGNHEDAHMDVGKVMYTLGRELVDKFGCRGENQELLCELACLYDVLPHVLYVECNKHCMIFSHAGFDVSYNCKHLLIDPVNHYECLNDKKENCPYLSDSTRNRAVHSFNLGAGTYETKFPQFCCFGFNWCDFGTDDARHCFNPQQIEVNSHGYSISLEVFATYLHDINKELAPYGISIIGLVRGHQHSHYGLMLFDPTQDIQNRHGCDWKELMPTSAIQSPTGFSMTSCYPVFTLTSAAEGMGHCIIDRVLSETAKDSYCIITTGKTPSEWFIKPYEYEIPICDKDGIYSSIVDTGQIDPIRCIYSLSPRPNPIAPTLCKQERFSLRNDTDDEVDAILNRVKKRLSLSKMQSSEAVCKPNALSYPIGPEIRTQSLNHMRLMSHTETITRKLVEKFTGHGNVTITENVLLQEILHPDCFVFYHGHENKLARFHDILRLFYRWGLLNNCQPLPLRFIVRNQYAATIDEFLEKKNVVTTPPAEELLAVNCALFGNNMHWTESSLHYFVDGASIHQFDIEKTLRAIFDAQQIPGVFFAKIIQATDAYEERKPRNGVLLQIFVKKDAVDDVAYVSSAGDMPFDAKLIDSCWDENKKRHTKIAPILAQYQVDLNPFRNCLPFVAGDEQEKAIDGLQARLWLPAPALYDPTKIKIIRYGDDMANYEKYLAELDAIFQEIMRYFIQQKLAGNIAILQHAQTPLRVIDDIVSTYKLEQDAHHVMQAADYHNLEINRQPVPLSPENRFFQLCDQVVRNGMADSIKTQLKVIVPLCKDLPGGSTPLIHAIKLNCMPLIEFILKIQRNAALFVADDCGLNALDWAQVVGNKNSSQFLCSSLSEKDFDRLDSGLLFNFIENVNDPRIVALALKKLVDTPCDETSIRDLLLNVIKKTNDNEILAIVIQVANKLSEVSYIHEVAHNLIKATKDAEILKLVIINLLDKFAMSDSEYAWGLAADCARMILATNDQKEIIIAAMKLADTLKKDQHFQFEIAKEIINQSNGPEVLIWGMALASEWAASLYRTDLQRFLVRRNQAYLGDLVGLLLGKLPNSDILNGTISLINSIMDHGKCDVVFALTDMVIDNANDAATLNWALTIAERLGAAGDKSDSIKLAQNIFDSDTATLEICRSAKALMGRMAIQ